MAHTIDLARHAISALLNGEPPNGTIPAELGEWGELYSLMLAGYANDGAVGARQIFDTAAHVDSRLYQLISSTAPLSQPWGPILPFYNPDLPAFPLDIFPGWLREFCAAITEAMQTPPDLAGMLALSVLSTICGGRCAVRAWSGWLEPVHVYTVTSLTPGNRKSAVFRAMTAPLIKYEQVLTEKIGDAIARTESERDILKQQLEAAKKKASRRAVTRH